MIQITNNTREDMAFVTGQQDGAATFDVVPARGTKRVAISADDPTVRARVHAQSITITATKPKAPAPKPPDLA